MAVRFFDGSEIRQCVSLGGAIDAMRELLERDIRSDEFYPKRTLIWRDRPIGVFGVMPGYCPQSNLFITKIAAYVPKGKDSEKSVNSIVTVFNGQNGKPIAILDGDVITNLKCAAVTAIVTDHCAPQNAKILGVIGAGIQAREQIKAVCTVRDIEVVNIYSRSFDRVDHLIKEIKKEISQDVVIRWNGDIMDLCASADILSTATTSNAPLFEEAILKQNVHINCMGAHTANSREIPFGLLERAILIVEDRQTAMQEAGAIHERGIELHELVRRPSKIFQETLTVFSSTGHISLDMTVTACIMRTLGR